jgi:hypothetical protein
MAASERGSARGGGTDDVRPESAMGGTSDAGSAADDAAEAAAFHRGLPDDATQAVPKTPGAGTGLDKGTRGLSGGQTPEEDPVDAQLEGDATEESFKERGGGLR